MRRFRYSGRHLGIAALLAGGFLPSLAHAQVYDRIAPKTLPGNEPVTVPTPSTPAAIVPADRVVLPALKGLVFVPDFGAQQKDGLPSASAGPTGIAAQGLPLLADPGFTAQLSPYIGRQLTLA